MGLIEAPSPSSDAVLGRESAILVAHKLFMEIQNIPEMLSSEHVVAALIVQDSVYNCHGLFFLKT